MSIRNAILDNLEQAFQAIIDDPSGYEIKFSQVTRFWQNQSTLAGELQRLPLLVITDDLPEVRMAQDETNCLWALPVLLSPFTHTVVTANVHMLLNQLQTAVKQFVFSNPDLGDNVVDVQYDGATGNGYSDTDAWTGVFVRIIYWTTRSEF